MAPEIRRGFVIVALILLVFALLWASRTENIPPADFSLQNGTDPKTIDPHRASGQPESRIIFEIFEGLMRMLPEGEPDPETGLQALSPQPGMAESYDVSEDGKTYTFHLRDDILWTDGTPVTAHDFAWSWHRMLHPATGCEYGYLINELRLAEAYHKQLLNIGDQVEVELWDRPEDGDSKSDEKGALQHFPRGTVLYGWLREIEKTPEPEFEKDDSGEYEQTEDERNDAIAKWKQSWIYRIDIVPTNDDDQPQWDGKVESRRFSQSLEICKADENIERTHFVLVDFVHNGGAQAIDDKTFVVHLNNSIPYFLNLVAYYPLFPVNKKCIETHGAPLWTKAENIVTNGPFNLDFRRLRNRVRVRRNPDYWALDRVGLETIDFMSLESQNTALNMYETGQLHWINDLPTSVLEELKKRDDFHSGPKLSIYFYKLNTAVKPLDQVKVRQALSMAINRKQIVEEVTKAGQQPALSVVPPGLAGYQGAEGLPENLEKARELLAEAGYPGGRGFPKLTLMYNTSETHRPIAEVIQQQLQNNLNIKIELKNMEWGSFIETVQQEDYQMARYGWVGDYPDPNTFLDLWVSSSPQSNTNWKNPEYDRLIVAAGKEFDSKKRMELLRQAEQILATELPIIPIYFYTSAEMAKPNIEGFAPSAQDLHPLSVLRIRDSSTDTKE